VTEFLWCDAVPRPAADQMAIDLAMVTVAREERVTLFRLYRWARDTVSFGRHEAAAIRWDRARLERDEVATVRRPTGGRAVWHDQADLTYAWTGPVAGPAAVRQRYREVHQQLAMALAGEGRALALAAAERGIGLGPGACFDVPAGGEVLVDGRKAIGSAQRVVGDHLLQHGAIAIADRSPKLARYRRTPGADAPLLAATLPPASVVEDRLAGHWRAAGALPIPEWLTSRIVLASVEESARHADPEWTWRR
jgi:lipoate-protein ligase A